MAQTKKRATAKATTAKRTKKLTKAKEQPSALETIKSIELRMNNLDTSKPHYIRTMKSLKNKINRVTKSILRQIKQLDMESDANARRKLVTLAKQLNRVNHINQSVEWPDE